jgi:nitroimidazol reductase NimA-like FMN-containing flavoprotein (pyridoxamine 5'-phosphate oxidase superfamily)
MASLGYEKTKVNKFGRLANRGMYSRSISFYHPRSSPKIQLRTPTLSSIFELIFTRCIRLCHHPWAGECVSSIACIVCGPRASIPGAPVRPIPCPYASLVLTGNNRPMIGCTGNFQDQSADPNATEQDVYIHGYVSGRIFRSGKNAEGEGLPITVAATFLDGLVLSLTPFHNSCNYRSAVVYGYASLVEDKDEALYAMKLITDNLLPGRWDGSRVPPTQAELNSTSILRVRISSASAKIRVGGPYPSPLSL